MTETLKKSTWHSPRLNKHTSTLKKITKQSVLILEINGDTMLFLSALTGPVFHQAVKASYQQKNQNGGCWKWNELIWLFGFLMIQRFVVGFFPPSQQLLTRAVVVFCLTAEVAEPPHGEICLTALKKHFISCRTDDPDLNSIEFPLCFAFSPSARFFLFFFSAAFIM